MSWFIDLAKMLIPPTDADPNHIYNYRLVISGWVLAVTILSGVHVALACGFLTSIFPGFASAAAIKEENDTLSVQNKRLDAFEQANLGAQIFNMREKQCKAPAGARDVYTTQLNDLYYRYSKLSPSQQYRLPGCEEF